MTARKATPAAVEPAAGADEKKPDYEVVGDQLVCHRLNLRLPLLLPMASFEVYNEINSDAKTWTEQITAWRERVIPAEVLEVIAREEKRDYATGIELVRKWAWGIDVRLGKALS